MSYTQTGWSNRRAERTRAALIEACRAFMSAGRFRPTMRECCEAANCSLRTGFQHFHTVEALHLEALEDAGTRRSVLGRLIGAGDHVTARALVTGRA